MENEPTEKQNKKGMTSIEWQVVGVIIAILLAFCGVTLPIQILFYILAGWFFFLQQVIPRMIVSMSAVVTTVLLLAVIAGFVQLLGIYAVRRLQTHHSTALLKKWRVRYTCALLVLLVISFAGGFAVVGVAYQSARLVTGKNKMIQRSFGRPRLSSLNNVRNVGLAVVNYSSGFENHLPTGVINSTGQPLHSWETQLLPYLDDHLLYEKIDLTQPWNSTTNSEVFKTSIPIFKMPGSDRPRNNEDGYGLSYYSLNKHVFYPTSAIKYDQIPDGLANTIMAGEVIRRVPAWGKPLNIRDPALGINKHVDGFGAPWKQQGANFIFLDGSGKFLSNDIDPKILKALSTHSGGDSVGDLRK